MNKELKKVVIEPKLVSRIPVKKNRVVLACVLIGIMGVLWLRVFLRGKKSPTSAGAGTITTQQGGNIQSTNSGIKIEYIKLPVVEGRNDVLVRDMFSAGNWPGCPWVNDSGGYIPPVKVVEDRGGITTLARKAASKITLEVIITNKDKPEAIVSIDDQPRKVTIGSILKVSGSSRVYIFEVKDILNNRVVVTWTSVKEMLTNEMIEAWERFDYEMTMFER